MDPDGVASEIEEHGDETEQCWNKLIVQTLYESLALRDSEMVSKLLAGDLKWWFHGPPGNQHMIRILTGESNGSPPFEFRPRRVTPVWDCLVIAEGWEGKEAYWVHVWTVKHGTIVELREYFDTWLTVRDTTPVVGVGWEEASRTRISITLWQSQPTHRLDRSLPGLLFAIKYD